MNKSDVTIIIPTLANERNAYALKECLTSLFESGFPKENILVVYNGEFGINLDLYAKVMWVEDQGQCKAVNAAAATVNTPWIMVSNDDMIYPPNWFDNLTSHMKLEPIQCVSPQLVEPRKGAPTFIEYFCGGVGGDFNKQKFLEFAEKHDSEDVVVRNGFNLPFLIEKNVWDLVGGYDVAYDPWGSNSDSDLEYKLKLAGVQPVQNTGCLVYHYSNTSDTFLPKNHSFWERNWQYFIEKWGFPRTDDGIWEATFDIPTLEEGRKFAPYWEDFYAS